MSVPMTLGDLERRDARSALSWRFPCVQRSIFWPKAIKFGMMIHVGRGLICTGLGTPTSQGSSAPQFWGTAYLCPNPWRVTAEFCVVTHMARGCIRWGDQWRRYILRTGVARFVSVSLASRWVGSASQHLLCYWFDTAGCDIRSTFELTKIGRGLEDCLIGGGIKRCFCLTSVCLCHVHRT